MGILGGILLLVGVILFFLGFVPIALFIGGIGVLFAVMEGGNGAAKGFGGGCLVIVAILGVGGYFLYNVLTADGDSGGSRQAPPAKTSKYSGKRKYIKEFIDEHDGCRIAAITKKGGDIAISGNNAYICTGAYPRGLEKALHKINDSCHKINDVCLTEAGKWVVIYGGNGCMQENIPQKMYNAIKAYHDDREEIYCAAFNDAGDWVVISDKHYSVSSPELMNWLKDGQCKYGNLQYVTITDDARMAIFEHGYLALGNYPKDLWEALGKNFKAKVVKMAGTSWFIANETGRHNYSM